MENMTREEETIGEPDGTGCHGDFSFGNFYSNRFV